MADNFKVIKNRWKHYWESSMWWLLIKKQPSQVIGNAGIRLEKRA